MIRKFKALGLALVAVFAFSALAATGASAATFHSDVEPTIITGSNAGEGSHVFKASGAEIQCPIAEFKGTAAKKTENTIKLHPTYGGCIFLEENAAIDTTGCDYIFHGTTNAGGHLPVQISCTGTNVIKVTTGACTLSFGNQTATGGVKATNFGSFSSRDMTVDATATVTFTKSGPLCFLISGTTGTYTGGTTVKGYVDNGVTGNIDEGATYKEGAQVGVWWE